jgi:hypothetical protein
MLVVGSFAICCSPEQTNQSEYSVVVSWLVPSEIPVQLIPVLFVLVTWGQFGKHNEQWLKLMLSFVMVSVWGNRRSWLWEPRSWHARSMWLLNQPMSRQTFIWKSVLLDNLTRSWHGCKLQVLVLWVSLWTHFCHCSTLTQEWTGLQRSPYPL